MGGTDILHSQFGSHSAGQHNSCSRLSADAPRWSSVAPAHRSVGKVASFAHWAQRKVELGSSATNSEELAHMVTAGTVCDCFGFVDRSSSGLHLIVLAQESYAITRHYIGLMNMGMYTATHIPDVCFVSGLRNTAPGQNELQFCQ